MTPCPFCGSDLVEVIFDEQYRGHCYDCKSTGPRCPSIQEAHMAWNDRILLSALELKNAWARYEHTFGCPPHGSLNQIKALLSLVAHHGPRNEQEDEGGLANEQKQTA